MLPATLTAAFATLTALLDQRPDFADSLRTRWRVGGREVGAAPTLGELPAADLLTGALPPLTQSQVAALGALFAEPAGEVLFSWCAASTWRRDVQLAPL